MNGARRWARSEILGSIRAFADEHGRPPRQTEWRRGRRAHPTDWFVVREFGSWQRAVAAAGYVPAPPQHRTWTDEQVFDAIRSWCRRRGDSPRDVDWLRASVEHPSTSLIRNRFGNFVNARRLARVPPPRKQYRKEPWTREEIRDVLHAWVAEHGMVPSSPEWERGEDGRPNSRTLRLRFGSWAAALEACGLTPRDPRYYHTRWSRDQIIAAFQAFFRKHGRRPTSKDLERAQGALPSRFTIERRFGTMRSALLAAGLPTELPTPAPATLPPRAANGRFIPVPAKPAS